jgi:hypothetical protein
MTAAGALLVVMAQASGPALLRFEDVHAELPFPGLKERPLDADARWRVSVGGEARLRFERARNPEWDPAQSDTDGTWLQRYSLFGDFAREEGPRAFVQLGAAFADGRPGGPSPVDENQLWVQNAFVEFGDAGRGAARARIGRQELRFGSARLVDVREGPNVRRTFDALRLTRLRGAWTLDALAARAVRARRGVLDDAHEEDEALWGLYATRRGEPASWDVYYLGTRHARAASATGAVDEHRHSVGGRAFGAQRGVDWNLEAVAQFGDAEGESIRAWTFASIVGRTWDMPWRPRVALSANVASGDGRPADGRFQLFSALYPRGNYFSEDATVGPRNFYNLNPSVSIAPAPDWSIAAGVNAFWRQRRGDGVYAPSGALVRAPQGATSRYVGTFLSLSAGWTPAPGVALAASGALGWPGDFIRDTGPAERIEFLELTATFRF